MELISTVERAVSHTREHGKFIVIFKNGVRSFDSLVSAFIFYYHLDREASLWDVTVEEELLEKKCFRL